MFRYSFICFSHEILHIYILELDRERLIFGKGKYTTWNLTVQQNKELESFLSIFFLQNKY